MKFSIVMPTRNRAGLLENSVIPTILEQTYEDFELLICDNASSDGTPDLVNRFNDSRIKYFRTDTWIPKEKFFQWSLSFATGEFSTWFFDDDAMLRRGLEKINTVISAEPYIDVVTYARNCIYFLPDYPDEARKDHLVIPSFSRSAILFDSKRHLEEIYDALDILPPTPMVGSTFFRTNFMKALIKKIGDLFPHGHMGDYNIACFFLENTDKFIYLDDPIAVFGHWSANSTAQLHDLQTTMPEYREWISWIKAEYLNEMPWPEYLWPNCVAATFIDMAKRLDLKLKPNTYSYYRALFREINRLTQIDNGIARLLLENLLVHVTKEYNLDFLRLALDWSKLGAAQNQVYKGGDILASYGDKILSFLEQARDTPPFLAGQSQQEMVIKGDDRFQTIRGAARYVETVTGEDLFLQSRSGETNGIASLNTPSDQPSSDIGQAAEDKSITEQIALAGTEHILLYGTGGYARRVYDRLRSLDITIDGFVETWGSGRLFGLPLYSLEDIVSAEPENTLIILASSYASEIVKHVEKRGKTLNIYDCREIKQLADIGGFIGSGAPKISRLRINISTDIPE